MKTIILAGAVAAMMIPAVAFAQDASTTMQSETDAMTTDGVNPGGAMSAGAASATSDTTGSYTIVKRSSAEINNEEDGKAVNRNTDPAALQRTIDANPGLAEKLQAEGVMMDDIGALSVEPDGKVIVYSKS